MAYWVILTSIAASSVLAVAGFFFFWRSEKKSKNRYESFAPVRGDTVVKWLVDAQDHMDAIAEAIENATKEILIIDHILNPHIFMKRPANGVDSDYWRLDKMILRKAENGIKIYILLFDDAKMVGFNLGVQFTIKTLQHDNIKIFSHPTFLTAVYHGLPGVGLWTHHEKVLVADRSIAFVGGMDLCFGRWDTHDHPLTDNHPLHPSLSGVSMDSSVQKYRRWIGKDYRNSFVQDFPDYTRPLEDHLDRGEHPRLPYHDVSLTFTGEAVQDVVQHFIQRYNSLEMGLSSHTKLSPGAVGGYDHKIPDPTVTGVDVQVVRSVSQWSARQPLEHSIYNAYMSLISSAKHFIYIENQFFISSQPGLLIKVHNLIVAKLAERITQAYKNNEAFHVIVVMPLKPEFSGNWEDSSGKDLKAVSYWNYTTVQTGKNSLYNRLKANGVPSDKISQYFSIYGLRKHDRLGGKPITETIYIHSKVLIIDDRVSIIGSANINDRSMLGKRDSEMCMIIEDSDMIPGRMNGEEFQVGKFSHSLRCHLFREHLGLLDDETYSSSTIKVEDPASPAFYAELQKMADENTEIYKKVFGGAVELNNDVHNLADLAKWRKVTGLVETDQEEAEEELKKIRGSFVVNPTLFLKDYLTAPRLRSIIGVYQDVDNS